MSEEKKYNCEFCRLFELRTKALKSDDIEFVRKTMKEFSDLWLDESQDGSYFSCILDGSWPSSEKILMTSLEKARTHPNREGGG
jgi:hypothetical protein